MQTDTAAEFLIKRLESMISSLTAQVLRGTTEAEYRRIVGLVQGLTYAIELIKDTANKVANDEELIDERH